jgi:hypothetical protein
MHGSGERTRPGDTSRSTQFVTAEPEIYDQNVQDQYLQQATLLDIPHLAVQHEDYFMQGLSSH